MVININIKIEDGKGTVLNQYEERFDADLPQRKTYYYDTALDKDLEDFLAAYLSVSGHIIREKLIHGYRSSSKNKQDPPASESNSPKEAEVRQEEDGMELSIRIGGHTVFDGKIDLELPSGSTSANSANPVEEPQDNQSSPQIQDSQADSATQSSLEKQAAHYNPAEQAAQSGLSETASPDNPVSSAAQYSPSEPTVQDDPTDSTAQSGLEIQATHSSPAETAAQDSQAAQSSPEMQAAPVDYIENTDASLQIAAGENSEFVSEQEETGESFEFTLEQENSEISSISNYALNKAIEKYEANLCPSYREGVLSDDGPPGEPVGF